MINHSYYVAGITTIGHIDMVVEGIMSEWMILIPELDERYHLNQHLSLLGKRCFEVQMLLLTLTLLHRHASVMSSLAVAFHLRLS